MPSISRAQQPTGAGSMKTGKKMMKYQEGGMMPKRPPVSQEDIDRMMMEGESEYRSTLPSKARTEKMKEMEEAEKSRMRNTPPSRRKSEEGPKMMMGGGMAKGYKAGGKVRGAGCAKKGVRPCKMM